LGSRSTVARAAVRAVTAALAEVAARRAAVQAVAVMRRPPVPHLTARTPFPEARLDRVD